ncbi:hypothetical protein [Aurantiacibacter zhengii]|uniref:Uncharacterized protein n=1 Tax=Aurantiacibacter zhengii TaxID=2307003 RepID=A0A418NV34_9SPHN|nr:hypothetical protein [Aurantiacibacter zhengii]RIV87879.1 hypothetical protein D2V07_06060 [Aurantiacibacter zhengii]
MTKKLFTTLAAGVALVATPVLAQSDMAQRAAAEFQNAERLGGDDDGGSYILLGIAALGLIVASVVIATGGDDEDLPTSP